MIIYIFFFFFFFLSCLDCCCLCSGSICHGPLCCGLFSDVVVFAAIIFVIIFITIAIIIIIIFIRQEISIPHHSQSGGCHKQCKHLERKWQYQQFPQNLKLKNGLNPKKQARLLSLAILRIWSSIRSLNSTQLKGCFWGEGKTQTQTDTHTDITTYRFKWQKGRLSENS